MVSAKRAALIAAGGLVIFAFGRYSAPTKVVTETKVVEVEKKTTDTERSKRKNSKTTVVEHPDGTKETTTTVTEDTDTVKKEKDESNTTSTDKKVVERDGARTSLSVIAALEGLKTPVYGAHVQRTLLGPISVGAFGLTSGVVGASIGITF